MPVSIRAVLLVALFLLGGWGIVTSLQRTTGSLESYRESRDIAEWSHIAVNLLVAAQHLAYERGRSAVVLLADNLITAKNRRFIDERRHLADTALEAALSNLRNLPDSGYQEVSLRWHRLQKLRRLVDRDSALPKEARDATLAQRWFVSASELIRSIQGASDKLVGYFPPSNRTVRLVLLASAALELRITAGIEASYIAQARSAGQLPSRERLLRIYNLRGRADRLWEEIHRLGSYSRIASLQDKAESVARHHLEVFRPLQEQVLRDLREGKGAATVPLEQLTAASLPTLDGISELMTQTTQEAMRIASAQRAQARWDLVRHLLWFLSFLLLLFLTVYYLWSRVVRPLEQVDDELRRLGALHPITHQGNEIGRLQASVDALAASLRARDEAEQRLRVANEALGERVRESTEESYASEQKYRALIEGANDGVFLHEVDDNGMPGPFLEVNELACSRLGYTREELLRMSPMDLDDPAFRDRIPIAMEQLIKEGHAVFETAQMAKDGRSIPVEVSTRLLVLNGRSTLFSLVRDITERKWAEAAMQKLNRELRAITKCNQILVRAQDEQTLLDEICRIVCDDIGYLLAWVGYVEQDPEKSLRPVAWAGKDEGYIAAAKLSWSESSPHGQGPAGISVRSGKPFYVQDFAVDSHMAPWREAALQRGYRSGIALPLKDEQGGVLGVFLIYSGETNAVTWEEIRLLEELAADLSYGIHTFRVGAERERFVTRLQESMQSTIQVLASTVEQRDPHTAGHQRRVAKLAAALARAAGFSEEHVQIVYLAALVHDIGKVAVPAEILSKPGKLSAIEMSCVREHAKAGYEILHTVEFPWPIDEIVWQHHERLDGSGYPRGLQGDQILPEARVVAVSDLFEAMISHRPYRPALTLDAALAELRSERGTQLDAEIVDHCIKLFCENRFQFEDDQEAGQGLMAGP